jgi:hypothetical protein
VTAIGRLIGVCVMFAGVGIIGALASILASILVPSPAEVSEASTADANAADAARAAETAGLEAQLAAIRSELASMRRLLAADRDDPAA